MAETYAQIPDFERLTSDAYKVDVPKVEGTSGLSSARVEFLLEQSSRDIDSYLGWEIPEGATLRIDTEELSEYQQEALTRAVVAQVIYALELGEGLMIDPTTRHISGADSIIRIPAPRIAPGAMTALQDAQLYKRSGSAPAEASSL
jgi:hypothetical protein